MRSSRVAVAACALLLGAAPLAAQASPGAQCPGGGGGAAYCRRVAEALQIVPARVVLASAGGNPVPGTASTLGMRLGALPRLSADLRFTTARIAVDGIERSASADERSFAANSLALDASIGLFSGVTIAPTLGGFGSIDLLASVGRTTLPDAEGFGDAMMTWGAGARIGILRESFTAPGASVSAMYRRVGTVAFGDAALQDADANFTVEQLAGWSLRAAASKRLLGLGLTGGIGYDRFGGDAGGRVRNADAPGGTSTLAVPELAARRALAFGNASFTLLVLTGVAELGWQRGGSADPALSSTRLRDGGWFASVAFRLSI